MAEPVAEPVQAVPEPAAALAPALKLKRPETDYLGLILIVAALVGVALTCFRIDWFTDLFRQTKEVEGWNGGTMTREYSIFPYFRYVFYTAGICFLLTSRSKLEKTALTLLLIAVMGRLLVVHFLDLGVFVDKTYSMEYEEWQRWSRTHYMLMLLIILLEVYALSILLINRRDDKSWRSSGIMLIVLAASLFFVIFLRLGIQRPKWFGLSLNGIQERALWAEISVADFMGDFLFGCLFLLGAVAAARMILSPVRLRVDPEKPSYNPFNKYVLGLLISCLVIYYLIVSLAPIVGDYLDL